MNLTAEQIARKECEDLYDPEHVRVKIRVSWLSGFCVPDIDGTQEISAVFRTMTYGDNYAIEKATSLEVDVGEKSNGEKVKGTAIDIHEYKRLLVKRNLVSWSLGIPIERDYSGWMTDESYALVSSVSAPVLEAFVDKFEKSMEITEEEELKIGRQCAVLFGKSGQGVVDACEAVSMFCTYGNFNEKFGLSGEKLKHLSYKEYLLLKTMIGKENDAMRVKPAGGQAKSVGGNGRSRGPVTRIPMPGSGGA